MAPKQLSKWTEHLKKVRQENKGKNLKECMKIASASYKKN